MTPPMTAKQRDERVIQGWFGGEAVADIKASTGIVDWRMMTRHLNLPARDHHRRVLSGEQGVPQ